MSAQEIKDVLYADIPKNLKLEFMQTALAKLGNHRGYLSEAVTDAIGLWVAKNKK